MASDPIDKLFKGRRERSYRGKGRVYSWLRARHTDIAALIDRGELTWSALAARLATAGVLGRSGALPTANAMIRVFKRVCRDVVAEAEARAAAGPVRKHPSRMSPNWRPPVMPQAAAGLWPSGPPVGANALPVTSRSEDLKQDADAVLDKLRRDLARKSGRSDWEQRGRDEQKQ
jgi:hypothetical protein